MADIVLVSFWLALNGMGLYFAYRIVQRVREQSGEETLSDDTATTNPVPSHEQSPDTTHPDQSTADSTREAEVDGIVCPHCGTVQEAGFYFCESCINPLH